jgi:hypothetical protein
VGKKHLKQSKSFAQAKAERRRDQTRLGERECGGTVVVEVEVGSVVVGVCI